MREVRWGGRICTSRRSDSLRASRDACTLVWTPFGNGIDRVPCRRGEEEQKKDKMSSAVALSTTLVRRRGQPATRVARCELDRRESF